MYSHKLQEAGIEHYIAGVGYNFKVATVGPAIADEMKRALIDGQMRPDVLYSGNQTHSATVAYCDGQTGDDYYFGKNFIETDGLLTDKPGVALLVKYADCTPIVLYDPVQKILANLHSGWRGTVQKISAVMVERMVTEFGCRPEDMIAYLGPSIDQANYQVGAEVYEAFKEFPTRDNFFTEDGDRYRLSMLQANRAILLEVGLLDENIELAQESTYIHPELHSSRQEGPAYQLNALIVMMPKAK